MPTRKRLQTFAAASAAAMALGLAACDVDDEPGLDNGFEEPANDVDDGLDDDGLDDDEGLGDDGADY